jgi:hypothetical protein
MSKEQKNTKRRKETVFLFAGIKNGMGTAKGGKKLR